MALITTNIGEAAARLIEDDIVAIPTETVYGLAGNAFSTAAINKIFQLKKRPLFNPLIVHIKSIDFLNKVATDIPENALILAKAFWPGPLTLVLKKHPAIPDLVTAGKPTVAVRVPQHPVALALLEKLEFPLAAPSANPFGSISPTSAAHVSRYFKEDLLVILDGGECERGVESTIIGFRGEQPILYRYGAITVEEIESVAGPVILMTDNETDPEAPGMLSKHYAPKTETYLTGDIAAAIRHYAGRKIGLLTFSKEMNDDQVICREILSRSGDLKEAASNLYAALHRLDLSGADVIIIERFPGKGLGNTINDRLQRACSK